MAKIDLRVRLLRRLIASRIADMDDDDIARTLGTFPRNPLVDQLLGKAAAGVTIEDGTAAGMPVRSYRPDTAGSLPLPLVLNMHGGGHVVGYHEQCDWLCSSVAATVGAVVVSIRYRTAPAHPGPPRPRTVMPCWWRQSADRPSWAPTHNASRSWETAQAATWRPCWL